MKTYTPLGAQGAAGTGTSQTIAGGRADAQNAPGGTHTKGARES